MQRPSSVKIIGVIQEVTLYPPHNQTIILPSLYGHDPKKVEEFAAEIQTFRMSRQGHVSEAGWEYKPSQDCSEYRIQFAFDKETSRIVRALIEQAEDRVRSQVCREARELQGIMQSNIEALIRRTTGYNEKPWYKRLWIALFSEV